MKKMNWLVVLMGILFAGCMLASQLHSITGRVTDYNGKSVSGAIVTTTPPSSSVLTDEQGNYIIRKMPKSKFIVHVSKPGYADESVTLLVRGYDYPTKGDVQLVLQSMVVEEIVVEEPEPFSSSVEPKEPVKKKSDTESTEKKKKWWEK